MTSTSTITQAPSEGELNLSVLLKNMKPVLNRGSYVFCTVHPQKLSTIDSTEIIGFFRESSENVTLVVSKGFAEKNDLKHSSVITSWITLKVHSSLEAVGLTAAFATALTKADISANVIAGYFHDHIFVPENQAAEAIRVLEELSAVNYNMI